MDEKTIKIIESIIAKGDLPRNTREVGSFSFGKTRKSGFYTTHSLG